MNKTDFLDRRIHHCNHCDRSFGLKELNISSVDCPTDGSGIMILRVTCPVCHHRMRRISTNHRKVKKALEDYLRDRNMEIDGQ